MIMTGDKEYNMMNEIAVLRAQCEKLTAALREALIDARNNGLIYWEPQTTRGAMNKQLMLARIDAALSAASGEARGDDVFEDPDKQEWPTPDDLGPAPSDKCDDWDFRPNSPTIVQTESGFKAEPRPAPSEAPNVERAHSRAEACGVFEQEKRIIAMNARAEGISAERERCAEIAEQHEDSVHNVANTCRAIAAAIRAGAKP